MHKPKPLKKKNQVIQAKKRVRKTAIKKPRQRKVKRKSTRATRISNTPAFTQQIGYIIPTTDISGGIAVICQHVNRLRDRGLDVILISLDGNRSIDWFPNQRVPIFTLSEVVEVPFHALVATQWSTTYFVASMTAKKKYYFVQSVESRFYPEGTPEHQLALQTYQFPFIYMTEALWIQRWLKENFNHESIYVPNGMDETLFYPVDPIAPKGERVRVLLEGPVDIPWKGMADAFAAVKDLDCEIWCVSRSGQLQPEWRCDHFFTKVPMLHMKHIYSSCDILLKLSQVEGFFGPPMEMMACGGTAVVGNCTGHDEYIVDGVNALVVPLGNIAAAQAAVNQLIQNPELRQQLTINGANTAKQWRWEQTIDVLQMAFA